MSAGRLGGVAVLVTLPVLALVFLVLMVTGASGQTGPVQAVCATSGPIAGLDPVQAQNARIVAAAALGRSGPQAVLIAEMTALTESGLRVLGNPNDPSGAGLPNQGLGHDHDSLGLFQQRPSWGNAAARMDPVASTNLFLDALTRIPDWTTQDPWVVAQDVQRSAFIGSPSPSNGYSATYGGNYLAQLGDATRIAGIIEGASATLSCGGGSGSAPAGPTGAYGLPLAYRVPAGTSPQARVAVLFALAQRGKPYLWGASGPDAYDCSGLMHAAWARAGVPVTPYTGVETSEGVPTTSAQLQPGDLVLVPGSDGTLASPGHVGMYLGEGLVVHAPKTGDVVKVVTYASFTARGVSALRHIG